MAMKQFKSESKRLLELMINSIYTHKEIFLRELISNASDAIDKLCYISLTDDKVLLTRDDFKITIEANAETRTLTICDNGVGMTAEELETNLGVIAKSGSLRFKREIEENDNADETQIIGQFGVGFYSAFMVAARVTVISRAHGADAANMWSSEGADGYTITPCAKDTVGTEVIIEIKPDTDDDKYSEYLQEYHLHSLIKKYSDYIRWPIVMDVTKSRQVESGETDDDGKPKMNWEDYTEAEVVNSRIPIWQRAKNEVSDEDCAVFYKEKFFDTSDPASVIRISAEGAVSYKAMLFIPTKAPYDYYTREFEAGLQLYASGVLIMDRCSDLLPEHFRFVRGVVDSPDLSLNISRELLQHDRQLKVIAANIEKKIKADLKKLMENEPEKYETFYKSFATQLKYGIVNGFGVNRDLLSDLIMFYSPKAEKLLSLSQYVKDMPEEQNYIYYAMGESAAMLDKLPQAEQVREKGYDILYLTDDVDEFAVRALGKFEEKEFRSVNDGKLDLAGDDEKKEIERQETENRELLDFIKDSMDGKIAEAKLSLLLRKQPVCLTARGEISLEMERYFATLKEQQGMSTGADMKAERVLELNASHPAFTALKNAFVSDKEKAGKYARLMYGQALLAQGMSLENPAEFTELIAELMV